MTGAQVGLPLGESARNWTNDPVRNDDVALAAAGKLIGALPLEVEK